MSKTNLSRIVEVLNDGKLHDGSSMGEALNISRTAVWKIIKKLKHFQLPIQSIKNKGYLLKNPLFLLNKQKIKMALKTKSIHIDIFEQIDSTNEYLKTPLKSNKVQVCIAEQQIRGRGRFQRSWYSPFGQNIYLSLKYAFHKDISALAGLSLACGLAVCNAIESSYASLPPVLIKWPNDILCEGKKLAGILIEIEAETHSHCSVIIGVGININMETDDNKIKQDWTSIKKLTGKNQDRNPLCSALIDQLTHALIQFEQQGFSSFLKQWKKKDYLFKKSLRLKSGQEEFKGKGAGINEQGYLIIQLPDGSEKLFSSGDTTLLK